MKAVFDVIKQMFSRYFEDDLGNVGAHLAYFFLFSLFPALIFLSALMSALNLEEMFDLFTGGLPSGVADLIVWFVDYIKVNHTQTLMVGSLTLMFFATLQVVNVSTFEINKAYRVKLTRGFFQGSAISIAAALLYMVSVYVFFVFIITGRETLYFLRDVFGLNTGIIEMWNILRYAILAFYVFCALIALYAALPFRRIRFREAVPGALFVMVAWVFVTAGFSFYVENLSDHAHLYGFIGLIMLLMLWLYFLGITMVLGGHLNHILMTRRKNE